MLEIHAPEAEAIHRLAKGVVLVEELDRAHHIEQDFGVLTHPQRVNGAGVLADIITLVGLPSVPSAGQRLDHLKLRGFHDLLVVAPVAVADCVCSYLATVAMLAEFCMRAGLQCDHVQTRSVFDSENFAVDRSSPEIPASVFLAIDVDVWCTHLLCNLELAELIVSDPSSSAVVSLDWLVTIDLSRLLGRQGLRRGSGSD